MNKMLEKIQEEIVGLYTHELNQDLPREVVLQTAAALLLKLEDERRTLGDVVQAHSSVANTFTSAVLDAFEGLTLSNDDRQEAQRIVMELYRRKCEVASRRITVAKSKAILEGVRVAQQVAQELDLDDESCHWNVRDYWAANRDWVIQEVTFAGKAQNLEGDDLAALKREIEIKLENAAEIHGISFLEKQERDRRYSLGSTYSLLLLRVLSTVLHAERQQFNVHALALDSISHSHTNPAEGYGPRETGFTNGGAAVAREITVVRDEDKRNNAVTHH